MDLSDNLRVPDNVATRKVGEETVLLNLETGNYFSLEAVGSRLLELLEQDSKLSAIHHVLLEEFDVTPEALETDLLKLCDEMRSLGLLELIT